MIHQESQIPDFALFNELNQAECITLIQYHSLQLGVENSR